MGVICHSGREACDTTRVTASGTKVGEMPLLHKNSQGPKPGRTTTEGEHRGAREGSTWVFCLDPRGPISRHGGWEERGGDAGSRGPPSMLSKAGSGSRAQRACAATTCHSRAERRLGAWAQVTQHFHGWRGAQCPEDTQRGPMGSPGGEGCSLQIPSRYLLPSQELEGSAGAP